jgi:hypothetical protein
MIRRGYGASQACNRPCHSACREVSPRLVAEYDPSLSVYRVSHGSQEEFAVRLYRRENQVSYLTHFSEIQADLIVERLLQSLLRRAGALRSRHVTAEGHVDQFEHDKRNDLASIQ